MPMDAEFRSAVDSLHPRFEALIDSAALTTKAKMPSRGVYLFCDAGKAMYVGRSNNIARRYSAHTRPSSRPHQAAFAASMARRKMNWVANYKAGERAALLSNASFIEAFDEAKKQVRAMEFRAVEEFDQLRQALLEIYVSIALKTPFNDFNTH